MGQYIKISSIVVKRELAPDDDITELAKSINDTGMQIPVLLTHGNQLIDGLRRIEALRMLGQDTVEVVVANTYRPAVSWLRRAREYGVQTRPLTSRRIWELYSMCRPLMNISRSQLMKGTQHGTGIRVGGRGEFCRALGIEKEGYLQAITQVYKMALEPSGKGTLARELVAAIDNGQMTPYMAVDRLRRYNRLGDITGATEQVQALRTATSALTGIAFGLSKLGPLNPEVTAPDIDEVLNDMRRFRRTLQGVIHQLEKEQDTR